MAPWTNLQQINRFVNPTPLYISCKNRGLHLAKLGITAGRQAGGRAGRQAGRRAGRQTKFRGSLKFLKLVVDQNI